jgi:hypothetical protein
MTSCGLVHPHLSSPGEFAVPRSLRRRGYLGLRWFAAPRAFTSGAPHPRFSERGQSTANLWRNASNVALALDAPLRFAISLGVVVHPCTPFNAEYENFIVLEAMAKYLDWLYFPEYGYYHAVFTWDADNVPHTSWPYP